jgi:hypothetical protein
MGEGDTDVIVVVVKVSWGVSKLSLSIVFSTVDEEDFSVCSRFARGEGEEGVR